MLFLVSVACFCGMCKPKILITWGNLFAFPLQKRKAEKNPQIFICNRFRANGIRLWNKGQKSAMSPCRLHWRLKLSQVVFCLFSRCSVRTEKTQRAFLYTLYTETPGRAFLEGRGGSKTSGCVFGVWSDIPLDNSEKHKERGSVQSVCSPESQAQTDLILALAEVPQPQFPERSLPSQPFSVHSGLRAL